MKKYWILFTTVLIVSFTILIYSGVEIYHQAPPIPKVVKSPEGKVFFKENNIQKGKEVWQRIGGMEVGSIWGHGSYVAPDWTADYLHLEAEFLIEKIRTKKETDDIKGRLKEIIRTNTFDENDGSVVISEDRYEAFEKNKAHYVDIFKGGNEKMAIPPNTIISDEELFNLTAYFWWSSWAASTNRPNETYSYTSNFPHEPLIDNIPTYHIYLWSGVSVLMLIFAIAAMVIYYLKNLHKEQKEEKLTFLDPFKDIILLPSQRAVIKYFKITCLLILGQVLLGIVTVHYGVEGLEFFGIPLAEVLPYSLSRTFHIQWAIFWIATSWLATGLFVAPFLSKKEFKYQKFGVDFLFYALLVLVAGSSIGEWLGVNNYLGDLWFFFGHQGYEYVDLGRFWQLLLFVGLLLWMFLVGRNILYAIRIDKENKSILTMFLIATLAIGSFYASGLMHGQHTHISIVEYWRWWLVHLWVEGFFEVFATAAISILFVKLNLLSSKTANYAVVASATIFLFGGIIGTMHHLYFTGTPMSVMSLGAVFSALEVVPLTLVGFEIFEQYNLYKNNKFIKNYKGVILFFIGVSFWNMLGAGIFGFMINPPIALYYMQGLNTTAVHGHTALFGVYGLLGMGFMLFCYKTIVQKMDTKIITYSFWLMNIGLLLMVVLSVLPVGILQTIESVSKGYYFARSSEFLYRSDITTLKWLRMVGDVLFSIGIIGFVYYLLRLKIKKDRM